MRMRQSDKKMLAFEYEFSLKLMSVAAIEYLSLGKGEEMYSHCSQNETETADPGSQVPNIILKSIQLAALMWSFARSLEGLGLGV